MHDVLYLPDTAVDAALDLALRELLSTCFTKPEDVVFRERRYFAEPPAHRWMIRNPEGQVVAHIAAHQRRVEAGAWSAPAGGLAEVCVHPGSRGQGLVRLLLKAVHADLQERGCLFSVLFGDPRFYSSSGYVKPDPVFIGPGPDGRWIPADGIMVRPLSQLAWPAGEVHVPGLIF